MGRQEGPMTALTGHKAYGRTGNNKLKVQAAYGGRRGSTRFKKKRMGEQGVIVIKVEVWAAQYFMFTA